MSNQLSSENEIGMRDKQLITVFEAPPEGGKKESCPQLPLNLYLRVRATSPIKCPQIGEVQLRRR
jgi:hypothetical protein